MPPEGVGIAGSVVPASRDLAGTIPSTPVHLALAAGTEVWTRDGILPVQYLKPGDHLVTRNGGYGRLGRVESGRAVMRMIRVPAHALAPQRPDRDVLLPAGQILHLRGAGGPDQAARLNPEDLGMRLVTLVRLQLDQPDIIYANGLGLQSHMTLA